jgi:hypothetical protein
VRRLTDQERVALREIGPPGEGPVSDEIFQELELLGYGRWVWPSLWDAFRHRRFHRYWQVTATGRKALELDDLARQT